MSARKTFELVAAEFLELIHRAKVLKPPGVSFAGESILDSAGEAVRVCQLLGQVLKLELFLKDLLLWKA